ncbi:MAG: YbaN family protein [Oscillospiraceae bacterium]
MKILYIALGFIFFALGAVGAFIPVLPTTPFLLAASFFFAKGSQRFNRWFLSTKLYKNHLESFVATRSMTLKTKICLLAFASIMLLIAFFMMSNIYGRIFILCLIAFKYYYFIFRIKTITPEQKAELKRQAEEKATEEA